jgi:hypothetical protein
MTLSVGSEKSGNIMLEKKRVKKLRVITVLKYTLHMWTLSSCDIDKLN